MTFTPKTWVNSPQTTTPISADSLNDLEVRITDYADALIPHVSFKRFSNLTFDGVTDLADAINAALVSLADDGGGYLVLPAGVESGMIGSPIILRDKTGLVGQGHYATCIEAADGVDDDLIQNYVSPNGILGNAAFILLRDFRLEGNKAGNATGNGITLTTNPEFALATADYEYDPHPRIENVRIQRTAESGFTSGGRSGAILTNVAVYYAGGYGFAPSTDTALTACISGESELSGFVINAPSVRLTGCKSFYSGHATGSPQYGFEIQHNANLSACEAQDNTGSGFAIINCQGAVLSSCIADSNSKDNTGTYAGFDLFGATDCRLTACVAWERKANGSDSFQRNALRLRSSSLRNSIEVSHYAGSGATVDDAIATTSDSVAGNRILINNEGGIQAPSFAAAYTPNPYLGSDIYMTLTAGITITAPTTANRHIGSRLRFIFTQDGTGGWAVTWPATFKVNWTPTTTAGKVNVIELQFTGTNWYQVASAVNL